MNIMAKKHTTDPYVFGDSFWYTLQTINQKPNQNLKNLDEDSIIIMGSERNHDKKFLVDTIFVVKKIFPRRDLQ